MDWFIDEDTMATDSAVRTPSQQSVKAYVDAGHQIAVNAYASSNQSISSATATTVTFGTENYDVGADFASNTFTAPKTGRYHISGQVTFESGANESLLLDIKRNSGLR
jgi:hypothetical protein